jgi:hypothetical protein
MSIQGEVHGEDPTSERWMAYYREARARRRARGPELRTRVKLRKYRNRQRALVVSGFLVVGVLASICYVVLMRAS